LSTGDRLQNKVNNDSPGGFTMTCRLRCLGAIAVLFSTLLDIQPASAQDASLRLGVITFLSGPAAGPFGVSAKNAADLLIEVLNYSHSGDALKWIYPSKDSAS
jgi:hypothetical protein